MTSIGKTQKKLFLITGIAASLILGVVGTMTNILLQPAFAHALNIKNIEVEGAGNRGVTIVLGHASEPAYGAKPGIHDGVHGVEVLLEDRDTALPITGAQLKVDKYYFSDMNAFNKAKSVSDATEIQKNVTLGSVFGDPGHYIARQVQKDGICGYRLYGNISYFSVANIPVNSTVFCKSTESNTTKFNSPGWFGGFGCTEDIDNILFPQKNNDVNPSRITEKASIEFPANTATQVSANADITSNRVTSIGMFELVAMFGLSAAAVTGAIGARSLRRRQD